MSREFDFNPTAVLETTGFSAGRRKAGRSLTLAFCMEQSMMRLLTLLASVKRLTLSNKVPRSKTIHAQVVCLERGNLLVMWHRLGLGTCVQGVFFRLASETQVGG